MQLWRSTRVGADEDRRRVVAGALAWKFRHGPGDNATLGLDTISIWAGHSGERLGDQKTRRSSLQGVASWGLMLSLLGVLPESFGYMHTETMRSLTWPHKSSRRL